ncbi:hypothetical protein ABIE59_002285 [Marinobacter sp. MBR-99]|jgi:hypothetical protein|uniref:DUF3800 domain-containing protein n=1 Tax=Marinobacter sp. MBR-99 TaxID=3156461 RepID=UPI0033922756
MMTKIQVKELRENISPLRNWDSEMQMFYDETNNVRRLKLTEVGLNAPIENPFVLAGIATQSGLPASSEESLRDLLKIQRSANEIKFEYLSKGSYEDALGSERISNFLVWILDNDIYIHYSFIDILYWSILDIVESLMPGDPLGIIPFHLEIKSELHYFVSKNSYEFMQLLVNFNYPNIKRSEVSSFLSEILRFLDSQVVEDRSLATPILKQTIRNASKIRGLELPFLHDDEPGELIKDFSPHFLHRLYLFKNASHTFDRETHIEKVLSKVEVYDGSKRLDYIFLNSKSSIGVQISDVVAGLMGRHFGFVSQNSLPVLRQKKKSFSQAQLKTLELLRLLIDRSNAFSEGLLHSVAPLETLLRNDAFLHDRSVPDFLG